MKKEEKNQQRSRIDEEISSALQTHRLMSRRSYLSYAGALVRSSSPYRIWQRFLTYFRRFRLLSVILSVSIRILTIIETSALLIALAAVAIVLLPILLIITLITSLSALIEGRRRIGELSEGIVGQTVYVFFSAEMPRENSVLTSTLSELSCDKKNTVFCVLTPHIDPRKEFFLTVKRVGGIYLVKRRFFFRLRRLLNDHPQRVYYVY